MPEENVQETPELPVAEIPVDVPIEVEPMTQRTTSVEGPTPIDVSENIKLESYVNKTIVNDNNVVDVPVYEEKDKMLEEVKKMISDPPPEMTTTVEPTEEATTVQHVVETTTMSPPTTQIEETTEPPTVPVVVVTTTTQASEAETVFVPVMTRNNEHINVYEEKDSIVDTTTTVEGSQRVSFLLDRAYKWQRMDNSIFMIYLSSRIARC